MYIIEKRGDMAQLVERLVRNEEASGSNPLISTKRNLNRTTFRFRFFFFYLYNFKIVLRAFLFVEERSFIIFRLFPHDYKNLVKTAVYAVESHLTMSRRVVGCLPKGKK